MTDRIESRGKSVEEAVSEALLQLGARRDEVTVEVLDRGRSGLLGFLGGRPARVLVTRTATGAGAGGLRGRREKPAEPAREGRQERGREPRREPAREADRQTGRRPPRPAGGQGRPGDGAAAGPGRPGTGSPDQDREGGRPRRRGGRGRGKGAEQRPAAPPPEPQRRPQSPAPAGGEPLPERRPEEARLPRRRPPEREPAEPDVFGEELRAVDLAQPVRGVVAADVPETLKRMTTDIMRLCGFPCRTEVVPGDYHAVKVVTDDTSAGVLIGRHGATIDALEHIVERMAGQAVGDWVNLNLDVNNYRRRRQEVLVERTRQLVQRVQQTGREVHLEPLGARERRVVHLEVARFPGLRTFTLGGIGGKHVVIAPEGAGDPGAAEGESAAVDAGGGSVGYDDDVAPGDAGGRAEGPAGEQPGSWPPREPGDGAGDAERTRP